MKRSAALPLAAVAFAAAARPDLALACAACMSNPDSPIAQSMRSGVFVLLGVTAVVLGWFGAIILTIRHRAKSWQARKSALRVVDAARASGSPGKI